MTSRTNGRFEQLKTSKKIFELSPGARERKPFTPDVFPVGNFAVRVRVRVTRSYRRWNGVSAAGVPSSSGPSSIIVEGLVVL